MKTLYVDASMHQAMAALPRDGSGLYSVVVGGKRYSTPRPEVAWLLSRGSPSNVRPQAATPLRAAQRPSSNNLNAAELLEVVGNFVGREFAKRDKRTRELEVKVSVGRDRASLARERARVAIRRAELALAR